MKMYIMRKRLKQGLVLLLCFLNSLSIFGQDVTLITQADVDAFDQTVVYGDLIIQSTWPGLEIDNLDGLSELTRIEGSFIMSNNGSLTDITGLANLQIIEGEEFLISENGRLRNLDGLSGLTKMKRGLVITDNRFLSNIDGLSNLKELSTALISNNPRLSNLGLSRLQDISSFLNIHSNNLLENVDGLSGLINLTGNLNISSNPSLTNIDGLSNLTQVSGRLDLNNNAKLVNLQGLNGLRNLTGIIKISNNTSLVNLDCFQNLLSLVGVIDISDNDNLIKLDGLKSMISISGGLNISNNDAIENLDFLENLVAISGYMRLIGNAALTRIINMNNLQSLSGDIYIRYNPSLIDVGGFSNLEIISGSIEFLINDSLTHIDGLAGLTNLSGAIEILENKNLINLDGLRNLRNLSGRLVIQENLSLIDLSGIVNIDNLNGTLRIKDNDALTNLQGFEHPEGFTGNLEINGNDALIELDILSNLSDIIGGIAISENNALQHMDAFNKLTKISGSLVIRENQSLTSIDGLSGINLLSGFLEITSNHALTNLDGLLNLLQIDGTLKVVANPALVNINPLSNLKEVNGELAIISNLIISNVDGLSSLGVLNGNLEINNNPALANVDGLLGLEEFTGDLVISNSDSLVSIKGLRNLNRLEGNLSISSNDGLQDIPILENISSVEGELVISNNETLKNLDALRNLETISGRVDVISNDLMTDISGLQGLRSVSGTLSIRANRILEDCCGLLSLLLNPYLLTGRIDLYNNSDACNSKEGIISSGTCELFGINGRVIVDLDNNGCDSLDPTLPNYKIQSIVNEENSIYLPFVDDDYFIYVPKEATYNLIPIIRHAEKFTLSPDSIVLNALPENGYYQDFCCSIIEPFYDLSVNAIPVDRTRPGFESTYSICYANQGVEEVSGNISFEFQGDLMDVVSTSAEPDLAFDNKLIWNYFDLKPFEQRCIEVVMELNTPMDEPALEGGEILEFTTVGFPENDDPNQKNNVHKFEQEVVNSFDPNDKTCLTGNRILEGEYQGFVDYMIRFENKGTAEAVNISVIDTVDTRVFDINSLEVLSASHDYETFIENDVVVFQFKGIDLPFQDETNDGYVIFRLQTINDLVIGDRLENTADIYFDFNFPIRTNTEVTEYASRVSVNEEVAYHLNLYPNPTDGMLFIESDLSANFSYSIVDLLGREIKQGYTNDSGLTNSISLEGLDSGMFLINLNYDTGEQESQLIMFESRK